MGSAGAGPVKREAGRVKEEAAVSALEDGLCKVTIRSLVVRRYDPISSHVVQQPAGGASVVPNFKRFSKVQFGAPRGSREEEGEGERGRGCNDLPEKEKKGRAALPDLLLTIVPPPQSLVNVCSALLRPHHLPPLTSPCASCFSPLQTSSEV